MFSPIIIETSDDFLKCYSCHKVPLPAKIRRYVRIPPRAHRCKSDTKSTYRIEFYYVEKSILLNQLATRSNVGGLGIAPANAAF